MENLDVIDPSTKHSDELVRSSCMQQVRKDLLNIINTTPFDVEVKDGVQYEGYAATLTSITLRQDDEVKVKMVILPVFVGGGGEKQRKWPAISTEIVGRTSTWLRSNSVNDDGNYSTVCVGSPSIIAKDLNELIERIKK